MTTESAEFRIQARSCTLLGTDALWTEDRCFEVPIYQRTYSWQEKEIRRLVNDLLAGYFGRNGRSPREPMFIGTMQLSAVNDGETYQEIIDGQQRMSTLILLLKVLDLRSSTASQNHSSPYRDRLVTKVNGDIQQRYFNKALSVPDLATSWNEQNPYLVALHHLNEALEDDDGEEANDEQDERNRAEELGVDFIDYLLEKVYMVVIETKASLSKTLQIFDAINTSGMDLSGGDVFKVRYYEYLREHHGEDEKVFDKICSLYEAIDERNRSAKRQIVHIDWVLSLLQNIVITEVGLAQHTRNMGGSTFFERFFDVMLGVNRWDGFRRDLCKKVELTIEKIQACTDLIVGWANREPLSAEAETMACLIWGSRYGRYWRVIHMFSYGCSPTRPQQERFIVAFCKLLSIMSIRRKKVTAKGREYVQVTMDRICGSRRCDAESVIACLEETCRKAAKGDELAGKLADEPLAWNARTKYQVCRIAAMLAELDAGELDPEKLRKLIWEMPVDIEHIHAVHTKVEGGAVDDSFGEELNRIGNLVVLERSMNRSVSNKDYVEGKRDVYKRSEFAIVRNFADSHQSWSLEQCLERKQHLVEQLTEYLRGSMDSGG